jgi:predicted enzyme related to lactoylglutathione lyase
MKQHEKINYIEFPAKDLEATKSFFTKAFGWSFLDYGPDYAAFSNEGLDGGFFRANLSVSAKQGSALLIFYSNDLSQTLAKVEAAGATILQPIYSFPGGRRFHFTEPSGNEFAVWSDVEEQQD